MKNKAIKQFKQRWIAINKFQEDELRKLPVYEKFHQLSSIMRLAIGMKVDLSERQETAQVRARWIFLKRDNA